MITKPCNVKPGNAVTGFAALEPMGSYLLGVFRKCIKLHAMASPVTVGLQPSVRWCKLRVELTIKKIP